MSGGGSYEYGDPVTVSATTRWCFVNWTEGDSRYPPRPNTHSPPRLTATWVRLALVPTDTWYLAKGCTKDGVETWVLVENPTPP